MNETPLIIIKKVQIETLYSSFYFAHSQRYLQTDIKNTGTLLPRIHTSFYCTVKENSQFITIIVT